MMIRIVRHTLKATQAYQLFIGEYMMSFKEWWMAYSPGSPGKVAKVMANSANIIRMTYPEMSFKEVLLKTLRMRYSEKEISQRKATKIVSRCRTLSGLTFAVLEKEKTIWLRHLRDLAPDDYKTVHAIVKKVTEKYAPWAEEAP